jgi:CRISPR-associated protein Csm1
MSVQIFLHGKLLGIEPFLFGSGPRAEVLLGRSRWVTLLTEVLPRALLRQLSLSPLLLGTVGGGEFLVVLPSEMREDADKFLDAAAAEISAMSAGDLKLIWTATENLGDWSIVRRRLTDGMTARRGAPGLPADNAFAAFDAEPVEAAQDEFAALEAGLREATAVSWSSAQPGHIKAGSEGEFNWSLQTAPPEGLMLALHTADLPARTRLGILRGDVDNFGARLRRIDSVDEHIRISHLYKDFFAGELQVLIASLPDLAGRVTILHSGGDDFAVYGAWDSLIILAREIQRVFGLLVQHHLQDLSGPEAKTITMAMVVASPGQTNLAALYEESSRKLELAKTGLNDSFYLFGRSIEWKQLADAEELQKQLTRLVDEFDCSPQFLNELRTFYREGTNAATRRRAVRFDRPWRFHRRLQQVLEPPQLGRRRERDFERLCQAVIAEFIGKQAGQTRLRPTGRVALEWAQLSLQTSK